MKITMRIQFEIMKEWREMCAGRKRPFSFGLGREVFEKCCPPGIQHLCGETVVLSLSSWTLTQGTTDGLHYKTDRQKDRPSLGWKAPLSSLLNCENGLVRVFLWRSARLPLLSSSG